jgi:hypothetical protein
MFAALCHVSIRLPSSRSLKDKRSVVRSLCHRVRNIFNVSIAEVDDLDTWSTATLGVAAVSNDSAHARDQIDAVLDFIESSRLDCEIIDRAVEVVSL